MKTSFPRLAVACLLLPAAAAVCPLAAQTRIDLRSQSKNVDFSKAQAVRPTPVGSNLPAFCTIGEMWFKPDAIAGQNLFVCTTTNVWSPIVAGGMMNLLAGSNVNVTCTTGSKASCTVGLNSRNMVLPDGNNIFSGINSFPATATQMLTASTPIVCNATRVAVASAAPVTITVSPVIASSVRDGQVCIIQNNGSNNIVLNPGQQSNLKLADPSFTIRPGDPLVLIWNAASSHWLQVSSRRPRAATQVSGTTPVCISSGEVAGLPIPSLGVGDSAQAIIIVGKTSGDVMNFQVRQGTVSGAELGAVVLLPADTRAAIRLSLFQHLPDKMLTVFESISGSGTTHHEIQEITQTAGAALLLSLGTSGCSTIGQSSWIQTASAYVVEAP